MTLMDQGFEMSPALAKDYKTTRLQVNWKVKDVQQYEQKLVIEKA